MTPDFERVEDVLRDEVVAVDRAELRRLATQVVVGLYRAGRLT